MTPFGFELVARCGTARRGRMQTGHGSVETPAFMPVGTQATVKALTPGQIAETGSEVLLGNTYHLYLRPGSETIAELGGLHRFMGWDRSILTDSGGFQVFSLSDLNRVDDDGVTFRSHIDGSEHRFTPERSMEVQRHLGSDIVMAFDQCPALPATEELIRSAVDRTTQWARRCRDALGSRSTHAEGHEQVLFGIVQGGLLHHERERSAAQLAQLDLPGYAIGGLSVGESKEDMHEMAGFTAALLPEDRPRYLMGVGFPEDLLAAVQGGVDLFDCVLPTRMARSGTVLTRSGRLNLKNRRFARDPQPLDADCSCLACTGHSRAYLRHLTMSGEILGSVLATVHNVHFYQDLMAAIRQHIVAGTLEGFAQQFLARYKGPEGA